MGSKSYGWDNTMDAAAAKVFASGPSGTRSLQILDFANNGMANDVIMKICLGLGQNQNISVHFFAWISTILARKLSTNCDACSKEMQPFKICIYLAIAFVHVRLSISLLH